MTSPWARMGRVVEAAASATGRHLDDSTSPGLLAPHRVQRLVSCPMRPQTLLLAVLTLIIGGGLLFLLSSTGEEGAGARPVMGPESVTPEDGGAGPLRVDEVAAAALDGPGPQGREAIAEEAPLSAVESDGRLAMDIIVLDRSGGALLGPDGSLPALDQNWIRPVLARGGAPRYRDPLPREGLIDLPPRKQRASQRTGWFNSFERPSGDAYVALAFGEYVLVAEPIVPGAREVILVTDLSDVEGMYTRLEGRLPGMIEATKLVRIRPESQRGQRPGRFPQTLQVGGAGDRFIGAPLPPGRVTVLIRGEAATLRPALFAAKERSGLSAISLGARVPDDEQWKLRLGVLGQLQLPIADIEVTLAPGESRDLGVLTAPGAGAALLRLVDGLGRPVDATSVDAMVLGASGATVGKVLTWTFDSAACLYPLHPRPTELMVVQGDLGALVSVAPTSLSSRSTLPEQQVRMKPMGVVLLPARESGTGEAELWTAQRRQVHNDPRWLGSRYGGHVIAGQTLAVPEGSYVMSMGASLVPVRVRSGELVDVRSGAPAMSVKLPDPKTSQQGSAEVPR